MKLLIKEAKDQLQEARELIMILLDEQMDEKQKRIVLKLYRIIK